MGRTVLFGGTFNPFHNGHLALVEGVQCALAPDEVLLMPTGTPPPKGAGAVIGAQHRLAMLRLVAQNTPGVCVSDLEIRRPGPSFTVDTLTALRAQQPHTAFTLLVGGDMLRTFSQWREWRAILRLARVAAVPRQGEDPASLLSAKERLSPFGEVELLPIAPPRLSSSEIRARLRRGEPIEGLVPPYIARYIAQNGLYKAKKEEGES